MPAGAMALGVRRFDPSLLVGSFLAIHFFGGHKEKDLVDPPALSRIQHFIKRKIAYDLKQIQYAKTVFR